MIRLYYWHAFNQQLSDEIESLFPNKVMTFPALDEKSSPEIRISISLAEFAEAYPHNFMVLKDKTGAPPTVCVTHHNSFGPR